MKKTEDTKTQSGGNSPDNTPAPVASPSPEAVTKFGEISSNYGSGDSPPPPKPEKTPAASEKKDDTPPSEDKPLTSADYRQLRKDKKEERKEIENKAQQYDEAQKAVEEHKARIAEIEAERDQLQTRSSEWETKQKEYEAEVKQLKQRQEEADKRYVETHSSRYTAAEDPEHQKASTAYVQTLVDKLPGKIETANGSERLFVQKLRQDPKKMQAMDTAVNAYIQAQDKMDASGMDQAVQSFAKSLGMDPADDLTAVESAIAAAAPHARTIISRLNEIQQKAPALAQEKWNKKVQTARDLANAAFMTADEISTTLRDPNPDPEKSVGAILNLIMNEVPEMKDEANRRIAKFSEAMALDGAYDPPPLLGTDAESIGRHDQNVRELIQLRGQMATRIARSVMMELALPAFFEKFVALQERVGQGAEDTNPSGRGQKGSGDPDNVSGKTGFDSISSDYNAHR